VSKVRYKPLHHGQTFVWPSYLIEMLVTLLSIIGNNISLRIMEFTFGAFSFNEVMALNLYYRSSRRLSTFTLRRPTDGPTQGPDHGLPNSGEKPTLASADRIGRSGTVTLSELLR